MRILILTLFASLILISCKSKYKDYVSEDVYNNTEEQKEDPLIEENLIDENLIKMLENKNVGRAIITIADLDNEEQRETVYKNALENVHTLLIQQIGERYYTEEKDRKSLMNNYYQKQDDINETHYEEFKQRIENEVNLVGAELTSSETYKTTSIFSDVTSELICLVLDEIIPVPIRSGRKSEGVSDIIESGLCITAFSAMLEPLDQYFKEYAIIHSVNNILVTEHYRNNIMQLATAEDILTTEITEVFKREYFFGWLESMAELKLSMIGKFKAGFDLSRYFQIILNYNEKTIEVYLPEPQILSSETDFEIKNIVTTQVG
jgi:hypothetical protein